MTTEHGWTRPKDIARHIETVRDRLHWLESKRTANGLRIEPAPLGDSDREVAEIEALRWALPVLEAEFGAMLRMHREIMLPAERLLTFLHASEQHRLYGTHEFVPEPADVDKPWSRQQCAECGVPAGRHRGATRPEHKREEATT